MCVVDPQPSSWSCFTLLPASRLQFCLAPSPLTESWLSLGNTHTNTLLKHWNRSLSSSRGNSANRHALQSTSKYWLLFPVGLLFCKIISFSYFAVSLAGSGQIRFEWISLLCEKCCFLFSAVNRSHRCSSVPLVAHRKSVFCLSFVLGHLFKKKNKNPVLYIT